MDPKSGIIAGVDSLTALDNNQRQTATILRETLAHYEASLSGKSEKERTKQALDRIIREQAFTVLNRLSALRMAEARGFLLESVAKGYNSKGFQLYKNLAGTGLGETGDAYQWYLFSLFDEFSLDLAVLFDRHSAQGRLFPRESALLALLEQINHFEIEHLWAEDETIGWIYQYFNSQEERKKMRKESSAPRNSRELAVRNQFFTPRYVVEFLTDNTLGRIWYEMTQGNTALQESCRYLVRRPTEIFLAKGEVAPEENHDNDASLSQEELLKQPVYITYRPLKDPREIRMLDPACGSMHFGLYAFDLFERIYEEAWLLETERGADAFERSKDVPSLQSTYASFEEFQKDVPRLIIEHNIHGVDIDPRAVQIAGLSLWQRAQRAWHQMGIKPNERPTIKKSNIVCAEPMPGEKELLREFTAKLNPPLLGQLVETIFDKMELAGEAGTLLKIEEEIKTAISEAKAVFDQEILRRKREQGFLPGMGVKRQLTLIDLTEFPSDTNFWDTAEEQILDALSNYAAHAESGDGQKRLFAEDAAKGFAFIDLCRKRFDVVLMNPPFGDSPGKVKSYLKKSYGFGRPDAYMCFVFRSEDILLPGGRTGAITSRTFLTLQFFEYLRDLLLEGSLLLDVLIDLGSGVLDGATVETCAYCSEKSELKANPIFFNLEDHRSVVNLADEIKKFNNGSIGKTVYPTPRHEIAAIPGRVFAYRIVPSVRRAFVKFPPLDKQFAMEVRSPRCKGNHSAHVRQGLIPGDQFRFSRLSTEVPLQSSGWKWAAKGGDYSKFLSLDDLLIKWHFNGHEIKIYAEINYGGASRTIKNEQYFFRRGISFPRVSSVGLNARVLAEGSVFTDTGMAVIVDDPKVRLSILGFLNSRLADYYCDSLHPGRKFEIAHVSSLPLPKKLIVDSQFREKVESAIHLIWRIHSADEGLPLFLLPTLPERIGAPNASGAFPPSVPSVAHELASLQESINQKVFRAFGIPNDDQAEISEALFQETGKRLPAVTNIYLYPELDFDDRFADDESATTANLISYLLGSSIGRWDIRYATGERQPPELPDPFDPLPVCPPGMLQNAEGLPAEPKDLPADYPLRISWPGILVDDKNHTEDIVARVREALKVIWSGSADSGSRAEAIEQEACEILGVKALRDYFRHPAAFFANHLKRYSKSRRQAPIYWALQTPSSSYTLWLYYHRFTEQTLYTCVNNFVEPKLKTITDECNNLRNKSARSAAEEKTFAQLSDQEAELKDFRDELLRLAKFWKPNLNDGVQITAAPLWKFFQHKSWQKKLKETWEKLEKGDYDWAHLACSIWPERVLRKCHADRSLAIAHDVENDFWEEIEAPIIRRGKDTGETKMEWRPKELSESQVNDLIQRIIAG
jgi:hypothetical protein